MAAPKGNKYALGLTTNGQPPKYDDPNEIKKKIEEYFNSLLNEEGEEIERATVTGMALYLGFASRQSMYDYGDKDDYSYIIKRAKLVIENAYERMLNSKSSTGAIFALKNMGWKDKQEIESNQTQMVTFEEIKVYKDEE